MTVAYHPFRVGPDTVVDRAGRKRLLCAECGTPANAYRHRSPADQARASAKSVERRAAIRARAAPTIERITASAERLGQVPQPKQPADPIPHKPSIARVADWRLSLLRLAIEQALNAELSLPLRLHLLDAQKSLRSDLHGTVATAEAAAAPIGHADGPPLQAEPARGSLASLPNPSTDPPRRAADARNVARGFRGDKYRELFLRAVDAGFTFDEQGSGHVRLWAPDGASFSLSKTAIADRGHGFRNVRAAAKRAGLDVSGL